jgi:putative membrane protein
MKKNQLIIGSMCILAMFASCNNEEGTNTESETTVTTDTNVNSTGVDTTVNSVNPANMLPLGKDDSTFVMEAASGGMMEVEAGNLAQQKAANQRVKDFAAMMVRDHSQANQELKSMVASRNFMLPDSLSKMHRSHVQNLQKATNNFDKTYMNMMVKDHNEDVSKFEKASRNLTDAQLKAWAAKTLPVLKMHRDSAQAINKSKL